MALIFFDQNVMEKMSKKGHQAFQNNVDLLLKERAKNNEEDKVGPLYKKTAS